MGRKIRRVPLDFDHPQGKVWPGFLTPDTPARLEEKPCGPCRGRGYSPQANMLQDRWYGHVPFEPWETDSAPFTPETPQVRAFAERQILRAPEYYGSGEAAIVREAWRLCRIWNGSWSHHLDQADVDALIAAGRLWDFTREWTAGGWKDRDPVPAVTAAEVNRWSLGGFGHDAVNCWVVVRARCERAGVPYECTGCGGHGSTERYEGQRAEAAAWHDANGGDVEPPTGDGWQLWETVSEGSPISPVFESAEALAGWLADPDRAKGPRDETPRDWMPYDAALTFVEAGWAPTNVGVPGVGVVSGAEFIGFRQGG